MIKTKTIGKIKDLEKIEGNILDGIEIVRCTEDGSYDHLRSILLRDRAGKEVEFIGGDSSNRINIVLPKPPEYKEKFQLAGMFLGLKIDITFDEKRDAERKLDSLKEHDPVTDLKVNPVQVEI